MKISNISSKVSGSIVTEFHVETYVDFMVVLKTFAQKCSNDDLGLTLHFYGKVLFAFPGFHIGRVMELLEDLGAKVN